MILRLVRLSEYQGATLGALMINDWPAMYTLEDAWRDNERLISCIPEKNYIIKRVKSPKFSDTFEVTNVEGRSHILFHAGNTDLDTSGCILLGQRLRLVNNAPMLLNSRKALIQFMNYMQGESEASLSIINTYGGGRVH